MGSSFDLHSQRPEYQREGIDLTYGYVQDYVKRKGVIIDIPFKIEHIFISNSDYIGNYKLKGGLYLTIDDSVYIRLSLVFNLHILLHELIHAFSSSHRGFKKRDTRFTGFSQDIYSGTVAAFDGFNEGVTKSIEKIIVKENSNNILQYQEKYFEIWREINAQLKHQGEKTYEPGFYTSHYKKENVGFIQVFIDTLCYVRLKGKDRDFEEERKKIWKELERAYFTGDIRWLESACHEIDATGKLQDKVEVSSPSDEIFGDLTQKLIFHTRENFNGLYIPTKL